ncbi:MAG: diadenylate cyclase [Christensenellaceae bacterium]|jgi:diadenylate cyclase|nr:diadenylate cyclase [Christensenellaceae bacterium]
MNGYELRWTSFIDASFVAVLFVFATYFFVKKKAVLPFLLYFVVFATHVCVIILDLIYSIPVSLEISRIIATFFIIVLIVVYQSDFKNFFYALSSVAFGNSATESSIDDDELRVSADEIVRACQSMSKVRTGALIVMVRTETESKFTTPITETGTDLSALVSSPLLECIFNTKAPLHDGAVIIKGNRILAAGCFLPLSQKQSVSKSLGTRHRAGIGITEENPTAFLTIILSEETGIISYASKGDLSRFVTPERLRDTLYDFFKISQVKKTQTRAI